MARGHVYVVLLLLLLLSVPTAAPALVEGRRGGDEAGRRFECGCQTRGPFR